MLANRAKNIKPSLTLELTEKIAQLRRQGVDIISMNVGEPDFGTPEHICREAKMAIDAQKTKYTAASGIKELRAAICGKLLTDNQAAYCPEEICVGTGAKQPLINAVLTLCQEGDEVILPVPCWFSYVEMIRLSGATPVIVHNLERDGFALNLAEIEQAITPRTKAILINTPNNPTGAVYTEAALTKLGELACKHDFYIISDEVYEKLVYGGQKHFCLASLSEEVKMRSVIINGFSKAYAMTGWRVGYAAASKEIIRGITAIQGHSTSNACSIAQAAALAALTGPQDCVENMRQAFDERRRFLTGRLNQIRSITCAEAAGAFYLMPNVSQYYGTRWNGRILRDSFDVADYLLEHAQVAVAPGSAFEAPDHLRIAYSNSMENLKAGMDRMEAAFHELQ